jgi:hypothetical protein
MNTFQPRPRTGNTARDRHSDLQVYVMNYLHDQVGHNVVDYPPSNFAPKGTHFRLDGHPINFRVHDSDSFITDRDYSTIVTKIVLEIADDIEKPDEKPGWLKYSRADTLMVYLTRINILLTFPQDALWNGLDAAIKSGRAERENAKGGKKLYLKHRSDRPRKDENGEPYYSLAWMVELYEILSWPDIHCYVYDLTKQGAEARQAVKPLEAVIPPPYLDISSYSSPNVPPDIFNKPKPGTGVTPKTPVQQQNNGAGERGNVAPSRVEVKPSNGNGHGKINDTVPVTPKRKSRWPEGTKFCGQVVHQTAWSEEGVEVPLNYNLLPIEQSGNHDITDDLEGVKKAIRDGRLRTTRKLCSILGKETAEKLYDMGVIKRTRIAETHRESRVVIVYLDVPQPAVPPVQATMNL